MIPKVIHYCWFSGDRKPKLVRQCIASWKRIMPDYEIKCWDGNSFDFDSVPFVREAISVKQYAAAADYVRLYALYNEGGIYLDSDVEILKPFDTIQDNKVFFGTEAFYSEGRIHHRIEAAIIGANRGNPFIKECMSYYEDSHFIKPDGSFDNKKIVMPIVISRMAEKYDYEYKDERQLLNDEISIYPTSVFTNDLCTNKSSNNTLLAIHHNAGSWIDYSNRGRLFRFCRKHDLMNLYHWIEKKQTK